MLDFAVRFHIVPPGELLAANRTRVALRAMDVRMVPTVRYRFVAIHATVQGGEGARELHKERRIVNVVIAPRLLLLCMRLATRRRRQVVLELDDGTLG